MLTVPVVKALFLNSAAACGGQLFFSGFDAVTVQGTDSRLKAGSIASLVALGTNASVLKLASSMQYVATTTLSPGGSDNSLSLSVSYSTVA